MRGTVLTTDSVPRGSLKIPCGLRDLSSASLRPMGKPPSAEVMWYLPLSRDIESDVQRVAKAVCGYEFWEWVGGQLRSLPLFMRFESDNSRKEGCSM